MSLFGKGYSPQEGGGSRKLPAGGYICRIMNAKIEIAKSSGLPMVVIQFDICDGEYSNFFHEKYDNDRAYRSNANYQGIARIPAVNEEGKARKGFNSFCGAVEKSNGITLPTEDNAFLNMLRNKTVGIIFGREEVRFDDGRTSMVTKPKFYRSVETIESGNYETPKDELLSNNIAPRSTVSNASALFGSTTPVQPIEEILDGVDSFSSTDDDIPF